MGAVDDLALKLARVWVPPHERMSAGKVVHVSGYWRRISEPSTPNGDCYMSAIYYMWDHADDGDGEYRLCQGTPLGRGPIEGERFGHAWVERTKPLDIPEDADPKVKEMFKDWLDTTVIDHSNGKNYEGPAELYYHIGNIDPMEVRRYTKDEMDEWIVKTGMSGPWEDSPIYGPINEKSVYDAPGEI